MYAHTLQNLEKVILMKLEIYGYPGKATNTALRLTNHHCLSLLIRDAVLRKNTEYQGLIIVKYIYHITFKCSAFNCSTMYFW